MLEVRNLLLLPLLLFGFRKSSSQLEKLERQIIAQKLASVNLNEVNRDGQRPDLVPVPPRRSGSS